MSFAQKKIIVDIGLSNGEFSIGGGNNAQLAGLRTTCIIETFGGPAQSKMQMSIYGLPLSMMNQLANVGARYNKDYMNTVSVQAGDDETGMHLVFQGQIFTAFVDARAMPQVNFHIEAIPGGFFKTQPATPISINGSADAGQIMQQIAGVMGLSFENNGVNVKLAFPYYAGSVFQQAANIARDAGFEWIIDKGTLAISPPGKPRAGGTALIAPPKMVGYPMFNENQVIVITQYDSAIEFGKLVEIKSDLTAANGSWIVNGLVHQLEANMPKGKWFSVVTGYIQGETVS